MVATLRNAEEEEWEEEDDAQLESATRSVTAPATEVTLVASPTVEEAEAEEVIATVEEEVIATVVAVIATETEDAIATMTEETIADVAVTATAVTVATKTVEEEEATTEDTKEKMMIRLVLRPQL